jgi:hypothetical protein
MANAEAEARSQTDISLKRHFKNTATDHPADDATEPIATAAPATEVTEVLVAELGFPPTQTRAAHASFLARTEKDKGMRGWPSRRRHILWVAGTRLCASPESAIVSPGRTATRAA